MDTASLIDQLLKAGATVIGQQMGAARDMASQPDMDKYAKGAAVGGLLGMLLGSRGGRQLGGKALQLGSMAALGMLAWKTYQEWQAHQPAGQPAGQPAQVPTDAAGAPGAVVPTPPPTFEALPAPQQELRGRAMLKAMIAAAKSDGHVNAREQALLDAELQRIEADPDQRSWVKAELARPLDAADVAATATSPQMAAEVYLASLLVVDETSAAERAYLDALAARLALAPDLKATLEARVSAR